MMDELKRLKELTEVLTGNGYLRDQAAEWEYALDAIPEFVYIIDTKHNLKFVNKALAERLGVSKTALYNEKCYNVIKGQQYANENDCTLSADCCDLRSPQETRGEEYLKNLNGWFVYDRSAIYTKTNKLLGFICILRDITERKRLEEETERRQKILDTVFNSAPIGLGLLKDKNREFITVNKVLCEKLEYEPEELIGQNARIIYPSDEEYERVGIEKYKQILETGTGFVETQFRSKSGELFDIALTTSVTGNDGELTFTAVDITNRKRREKVLKLNEDRVEALLTLSLMDDATEDELIDFVLEQAVALTESKIGYIHFVEEGGAGQIDLKLFKWSKAVHDLCGAEKVPHYPLERAGIWADCVRTMGPVVHNDYVGMKDKNGLPEGHFPIERHMSIPVLSGDKVIAVMGVGNKETSYDESDVKQLTLFLNSMWDIVERKRTENNFKELINSTPVGVFVYTLQDDKLVLTQFNSAAEQILNIKAEHCIGKKLDEVFSNLLSTELPDIYKEIAKSGGSWAADSVVYTDENINVSGIYSVFVYQIKQNEIAVFFSDVSEAHSIRKKLEESRDRLRHAEQYMKMELKKFVNKVDISKKILIVEDQRAVSVILGEYLSRMGFEITTANSGQDAVSLIDKNGICLVLVDLFLNPGPTGIEIIEKVVAEHEYTPVIAISGTASASDVDVAMRAGAWDFISKPMSFEVLKESVKRNLEQSILIKKSKLLDSFLELTN